MSYVAAGNIMCDMVEKANGERSVVHLGGPAFFALCGVKLYTDSIALCCNAGEDFESLYGSWMDTNSIGRQHVKIKAEHCSMHVLRYGENGTFRHESVYGAQNLGYLKTTPEEISAATKNSKGVYIAQNLDRVFWRKLCKIKEEQRFAIMWELEQNWESIERVKEVCSYVDYFSLNINEAAALLDIPREKEEDIIKQLIAFPVRDIFFRVGVKGSYALRDNQAIFVPSIDIAPPVDPTGCGNCSTGAAMYAYSKGFKPAMVAAMANVAAAYNVMQYGVYPKFDMGARQNAVALAKSLVAKSENMR